MSSDVVKPVGYWYGASPREVVDICKAEDFDAATAFLKRRLAQEYSRGYGEALLRRRSDIVLDAFAAKYETQVPSPTYHSRLPADKRWIIGNPLAPTNIYRRVSADSARRALVEALLEHDPSLAELAR